MADAILPGHTSPGTIKGSANHARPLFSFLLAGSKVRPADTKDNIFLSNSGLFISREHSSTFVPLLPLGEQFPGQLFLPPKPNGPRSICLSTKFLHNHLQLSIYRLRLTVQGKTSPQAVIKLKNHQYQRLHYLFSFF